MFYIFFYYFFSFSASKSVSIYRETYVLWWRETTIGKSLFINGYISSIVKHYTFSLKSLYLTNATFQIYFGTFSHMHNIWTRLVGIDDWWRQSWLNVMCMIRTEIMLPLMNLTLRNHFFLSRWNWGNC